MALNAPIRIGTRESDLAVWQAQQVQRFLTEQGCSTELVFIKSAGDTDVITPLYAMGVQGIFTKNLDSALLNHQVDIAVHSLKDVPIQAAKGLQQAAVLKRGSYKDIVVFKDSDNFLHIPSVSAVVATSSIRRKAQWLHRYPQHQFVDLRGNVNTRLQKLHNSAWQGAIFAAAGLERLGIRPKNSLDLDWMLPAPAQGAIAVYCRATDKAVWSICQTFNDTETDLCTKIERDFLKTLMGGCSAPISALATIENDMVTLKGNILSVDGSQKIETEMQDSVANALTLGKRCGKNLLNKGATALIRK